MSKTYYRSSARVKKKRSPGHQAELAGMALMGAGILSFYCVLFPAGTWGETIKKALDFTFGVGMYFFPLWVAYVGFRVARPQRWPQAVMRLTLWTGFMVFACVTAHLFGTAALGRTRGGAVGEAGHAFLARLFGEFGAWFIALTGTFLSGSGLLHLSPLALIEKFKNALRRDIEEWRLARTRNPLKAPPVVAPRSVTTTTSAPVEIAQPVPRPVIQSPPVRATVPPKPGEKKPAAPPAPSTAPAGPYQLPPLSLLADGVSGNQGPTEDDLISKAKLLEQTLGHFEVQARVTDIHPGPVITRFDLEPAPGVKISSIVSLSDDIALAMRATRVRVIAPIPGKGAVGVEIPNPHSATVVLKDLLADPRWTRAASPLTVALGKTSAGEPYFTDLAPMPHLLVAGATGTGKSVCIHTLIMSILMRATPEEVKFVLIDPKRLELPTYDGMPHLYDPRVGAEAAQVITQSKEAAKALQRLVRVMEHRYDIFAKANVRNIEGYNDKRRAQGLLPEFYIVVIIDELADLMLISAKEVEDCIQRLAQMARAVGIHLVLATQRPSVDVITGVIKANLPARAALRVASQTDSRVILDTVGAESLVGKGDMLFLPAGAPAPIRLQGAYVTEKEVEAVVAFIKSQARPRYADIFAEMAATESAQEDAETMAELDEALRLIMERKRVSQDLLKAHFGSSARATNVLSLLEVRGFIHKPEGTNRWEIDFDAILDFFRARRPEPLGDVTVEKEEVP
jgi:S-DNA-T family DNA segregation ATPase FtsK/SpoIIIE